MITPDTCRGRHVVTVVMCVRSIHAQHFHPERDIDIWMAEVRVQRSFAREPQNMTVDIGTMVNETPRMVHPKPVYILERLKTGGQSTIVKTLVANSPLEDYDVRCWAYGPMGWQQVYNLGTLKYILHQQLGIQL